MISSSFCHLEFWKSKILGRKASSTTNVVSDLLTKMEPEVKNFIDNVDSWIKQIRREFSGFSDIPSLTNENTDNIQHNYELIYELKDQVDELKQEINALKLIQIISLKKTKQEQKKIS